MKLLLCLKWLLRVVYLVLRWPLLFVSRNVGKYVSKQDPEIQLLLAALLVFVSSAYLYSVPWSQVMGEVDENVVEPVWATVSWFFEMALIVLSAIGLALFARTVWRMNQPDDIDSLDEKKAIHENVPFLERLKQARKKRGED